MHTFSFVLSLLVFSHSAYGLLNSTSQEAKGGSRTIFDDDLREFIEFLRLQMPCGYTPAGIPSLVPLYVSYKEVASVANKTAIRGNVTNLTITGLNEFDVRKLHFNNIFRKVSFDLNFPEVRVSGDYKADIKSKIRDATLHIFGDGQMNLSLRNLHINGSFVLEPRLAGNVELSKLKVTTELGDVESKLTGLMNSKLKGKLLNSWIEEFINFTLNDSQEDVNAAVQQWILPPANQALKRVPVLGVIALLFGLVDGKLPQKTMC